MAQALLGAVQRSAGLWVVEEGQGKMAQRGKGGVGLAAVIPNLCLLIGPRARHSGRAQLPTKASGRAGPCTESGQTKHQILGKDDGAHPIVGYLLELLCFGHEHVDLVR